MQARGKMKKGGVLDLELAARAVPETRNQNPESQISKPETRNPNPETQQNYAPYTLQNYP